MDSRSSTCVIPSSADPKPLLTVHTANHTPMGVKALASPPSFAAFRPSPLNPAAISSGVQPVFQKRDPAFPASRPLRPFPSVIRAITNANPIESSARLHVHEDVSALGGEGGVITGGKRSPKTIEVSSKWRGGFFVLGMTQAEFSRRG